MKRVDIESRREIGNLIERQMRNWELGIKRPQETRKKERPVLPFVALSRAVGLEGEPVAAKLGARLGWPVFDRQLLDLMAGQDDFRKRIYEAMDERDLNWIEGFIRGLTFDRFQKDDYVHTLLRTLLALARKSPAVFVGRACDLVLPQKVGLRVRLYADDETCLLRYAAAHGVSRKAAEKAVRGINRERARFFKHWFGKVAEDAARHDVIINVARFSSDQAVELILEAMRIRGLITGNAI